MSETPRIPKELSELDAALARIRFRPRASLGPEVIGRLKDLGVDPAEVPVVVGGIIPDEDARTLEAAGVAKVYTPKDYDLTRIVGEIAGVVARARGVDA